MIKADRRAQSFFLTRWIGLHRKSRIAKKRARRKDIRALLDEGLRVRQRESLSELRYRVLNEVIGPAWQRGLLAEINAVDPLFDEDGQ